MSSWLQKYHDSTPHDNNGIGGRSAAGSDRKTQVVTVTSGLSRSTSTKVSEPSITEIIDDSDEAPTFEENQDVERSAAHRSPAKGGTRLSNNSKVKVVRSTKVMTSDGKTKVNSQSKVVKMERDTTTVKKEEDVIDLGEQSDFSRGSTHPKRKEKGKRERATNDTSLPSVITADKGLWFVCLKTFLCYISTLENPWDISAKKIVAYMQPILKLYFNYNLDNTDKLLKLVGVTTIGYLAFYVWFYGARRS
ncbi:hypothetical protein AX17_006625 [Amanita inopinata Kibby_2008]|nr:hypothetical protein AX17_006625 [Amanita inopinata Kibby_2008]